LKTLGIRKVVRVIDMALWRRIFTVPDGQHQWLELLNRAAFVASCGMQPWSLDIYQQRFLVLPWVEVPHLASHVLALALKRLSGDWQKRYGHSVWLVETFVEADRFAGTAHQAAGWLRLGQTTGRTRQDRHRTLKVALKCIWVKPLHPRFREQLCGL
jgi:hypothetical protein